MGIIPKVDTGQPHGKSGRKARCEVIEKTNRSHMENMAPVKITWNLHLTPTPSNFSVTDDI